MKLAPLLLILALGCSDGDDDAPPEDAGTDATPDAEVTPVSLTEGERAAVEAQTIFEVDQMGLVASTARETAVEHTVLIRLPFPWMFFTNDMLCTTDMDPQGCRSGTSGFELNTAFATFAPAASYAYAWEGEVGTLAGTASFELEHVPTFWLDATEFEPNDDALIAIRAHTEEVVVTAGGATDEFDFQRDAVNDFDIVRDGEAVHMKHEDSSHIEAYQVEGGVDVEELTYEATYELGVRVALVVDEDGNATGEVTSQGETIAHITGRPGAETPEPIQFEWLVDASERADCDADCGERVCGRDPSCGSACGGCEGDDVCSPLGACAAPPPDVEGIVIGE